MQKISIFENQLNEGSATAMVKALDNLEAAWNYVLKIWYDDENVEDAMLNANTTYPFQDALDEIDIHKWIVACKKSLKNLK